LISGCAVIPVPATEDIVTFGIAVTEEEIKTIVANGENLSDIKLRFGDPIFAFGPESVFVYGWTINKGNAYWLLYNTFGSFPLNVSNLLIFAFDSEGKVLKAGTMEFKFFDTVSEQVREWLASLDLENQFVGPRIDQSRPGIPVLFAYRPRKAKCPFLSLDSNTFKLSISANGIFLGDLSTGEYVGTELEMGEHTINVTISPLHQTAYMSRILRPTSIQVKINPDRPAYIETYLCTGNGRIEMKAAARDPNSIRQIIRDFTPAW
jgi:hypothetical protein